MVPVRIPICLISLIWPIKAGAKDTKAPELMPLKAAKRIYSTLLGRWDEWFERTDDSLMSVCTRSKPLKMQF